MKKLIILLVVVVGFVIQGYSQTTKTISGLSSADSIAFKTRLGYVSTSEVDSDAYYNAVEVDGLLKAQDIEQQVNYLNDKNYIFPTLSNTYNSGGAPLTANREYYVQYIVTDTTYITSVSFATTGTAASFTPANQNVIVLYSWSEGTVTELTRTNNDVNMWDNTNVLQTKTWITPQTLNPGAYYVGFMYGNSAQVTAPTIAVIGVTTANLQAILFPATLPPLSYLGGQTSMPSSRNITSGAGNSSGVSVPLFLLH